MRICILFLTITLCWGCQSKNQRMLDDQALMLKAQSLAQKLIITDGHVDLPYRLRIRNFRFEKEFLGIPIQTDEGDFDYLRAKAGGLDAPFMSIYIPSSYQEAGGAKIFADSLIDMVNGIVREHPDKFAVATSPNEIKSIVKQGKIALPMGMENGAPIEGDLNNISYFKSRGISYITLTHATDNHICDSSYDTTGTWNGLSPFGRDVVRMMNDVGIMIDISHVSDSSFYQVLALTEVPVIASHSSCRVFTPGFERNMNDHMLRKLAENGGVIQINFGSSFLDGEVQKHRNALNAELDEAGVRWNDPAGQEIVEAYRTKHPQLYADVQKVADHIDHAVKLAGIDHVGLGSDFDGVGDSLPVGLKDVGDYPNLIAELLRRGYSEKDIAKICAENVFRVWDQVLKHAQS